VRTFWIFVVALLAGPTVAAIALLVYPAKGDADAQVVNRRTQAISVGAVPLCLAAIAAVVYVIWQAAQGENVWQ
jgi:hypothetical protein